MAFVDEVTGADERATDSEEPTETEAENTRRRASEDTGAHWERYGRWRMHDAEAEKARKEVVGIPRT